MFTDKTQELEIPRVGRPKMLCTGFHPEGYNISEFPRFKVQGRDLDSLLSLWGSFQKHLREELCKSLPAVSPLFCSKV